MLQTFARHILFPIITEWDLSQNKPKKQRKSLIRRVITLSSSSMIGLLNYEGESNENLKYFYLVIYWTHKEHNDIIFLRSLHCVPYKCSSAS